MSMHSYCTYFDSAYIPRGRILIESLRIQADPGPVFVLALDDETYAEVSSWTDLNTRALRLSELEHRFPQLLTAKANRSRMEYVFTLTPWITTWSMERVDAGSFVTYLDADMAFFSSTAPIYEALSKSSVGIVEHRFTWEQSWRRKYGTYNVAWVSFRKDENGEACLEWWARECLLWCKDEVNLGRFADQGYLDSFPTKFDAVTIIKLPGADVAPWNLRRHSITSSSTGEVLIDGESLIFFHFHGLRNTGYRFYFKHIPYLARTTGVIRNQIYRPYCQRLMSLTGSAAHQTFQMERRVTLFASLKSGRASIIRWLSLLRGDVVDIPPLQES